MIHFFYYKGIDAIAYSLGWASQREGEEGGAMEENSNDNMVTTTTTEMH